MKVLNVAISLALALATVPGRVALAQGEAPVFIVNERAASDRADELSKRALALASHHKGYAEAEAMLREAWGLKRSYDIAANLGIVEAKLEKWRDAAERLAYALRTFPANGKPEHRKLLETTLAQAAPHLAAVKVKVRAHGDAPVERAEVSVDGASVGVTPLEVLFLEPGQHTITAERQGAGFGKRVLDLRAGSSEEVEVVVEPLPMTVKPPSWRPGPALIIPAAVLAAGGLAAGTGLTVAANGKASDVAHMQLPLTSSCSVSSPATSARCAALHEAAASKVRLSNGAASGFLAGSAFAIVTTGLAVWAVRAAPVRVSPAVGAGYTGVTLQGVW